MQKLLLPRHSDVMSDRRFTRKPTVSSPFHQTVSSSLWPSNSCDSLNSPSSGPKRASHLLPFELFSSSSSSLTVVQASAASARLSPGSLASPSSPLVNVTSSPSPASLLVPSEGQSRVPSNQSDTYICAAYNPRCFIIQKVR